MFGHRIKTICPSEYEPVKLSVTDIYIKSLCNHYMLYNSCDTKTPYAGDDGILPHKKGKFVIAKLKSSLLSSLLTDWCR